MRSAAELIVTEHAIIRYKQRVGPLPYGRNRLTLIDEFREASRVPKAIRKQIQFWECSLERHGGRLSWNPNTGAVFVTKRVRRHQYALLTVFSATRPPREQGIAA